MTRSSEMSFISCSSPINGPGFSIESKFEFDAVPDVDEVALCHGSHHIAVYQGASLTVAEKSSGGITAELDFDDNITACVWSTSGSCVVVADGGGALHLVTPQGTVVFSQKITAGEIRGLGLTVDDAGAQTLVAIMENGAAIIVSNMDIDSICAAHKGNSSDIVTTIRKNLKIGKASIRAEHGMHRVRITGMADHTSVLFCDDNGALNGADIDTSDLSKIVAPYLIVAGNVSSFQVAEGGGLGAFVLSVADGQLVVGRPATSEVLVRHTFASPMNQVAILAEECNESLQCAAFLAFVATSEVTSGTSAEAGQILAVLVSDSAAAVIALCSATLPAGRVVLAANADQDATVRCLSVHGEVNEGLAGAAGEGWERVRSVIRNDGSGAFTDLIAIVASVVLKTQVLPSDSDIDGTAFLTAFEGAASGSQVMGLLSALLDMPQPCEGFITKALTAAELAVERLSVRLGPAQKQRYLLEILTLHHLVETAMSLQQSEGDGPDQGRNQEEAVRLTMRGLLPSNLSATLKAYLEAGRVSDALLVTQRCVRGALPIDPADAVRAIPLACDADRVDQWVRVGVVPRIHRVTGTAAGLMEVAAELVARATALESAAGNPFDALKCVTLARDLLASLNHVPGTPQPALIAESKELFTNLTLQRALWEHWQDEIRLEEIVDLGVKGVIFDRIDSTEEGKLVADLAEKVSPVTELFNVSLDQLLEEWIKETISSKIVAAGGGEEDGAEDDQGTCTLSRLVLVASAMRDRNAQAKVVLTLLQMPVLEDLSIQSTTIVAEDEADGQGPSGTAPTVAQASSHAASTRLLCDLASQAVDFVDGVTRDALIEATKLLRIKALAADYGIESFDPRNSKQVRSVVILIASSLHRPDAIADAVQFAASWGGSSVDMSAVLTRAIIQRCSVGQQHASQVGSFEDRLKAALLQLPAAHAQIVVDDALTFLLDDLEDVSDEIEFTPGDSATQPNSADAEAKQRAESDVRAALVLTAHYLEANRAALEVRSTDTSAEAERRIRYSEKRDDWITADLLARLKRLATLQTSHGVYLSIADLSDEEACQAVIITLARHRVKLLLADVAKAATAQGVSVPPATLLTPDNAPLDVQTRKACALLDVRPTFFTHTAMKLLVEASQSELAMEVAKTLSREKVMHATPLAQLLAAGHEAAGGSTSHGELDAAAEKEAALLQDAAVTLCAIAAKKANQVTTEDYAVLPSLSLMSANEVAQVPEHLSFPIASFSLSRELLRSSVASCPSQFLGRTLDLLSGADTVLAVYDRIEGAPTASAAPSAGATSSTTVTAAEAQPDRSPILSEGVFARDGILMQASVVAMPLMRFAISEVKRRSASSGPASRKAQAQRQQAVTSPTHNAAPDLKDLVAVLQSRENHLLAARILYSSWHLSDFKSKALEASLLALCRKVLFYRDIDVPFAVACLAALPFDKMMRELRAAVPSIQSDFARLRTIASVGGELGHLWEDESLLELFQNLQSNSKWWDILSSLGVTVDLKVLEGTDSEARTKCIRSLIPELFKKSKLNLDLAMDYCRQYQVEPEYAALIYIDLLLTAPPSAPGDFGWVGKARSAAESVLESALLQCLRDVLPRICAVDYEKIQYVCTWIIDLLATEEAPEDAYNEESDYTTTNFSLKDKPKKVSTAVLLAERGVARELETYKRFLDIVGYLSGLRFPAAAAVAQAPSVKHSAPVYNERVPLWPLLSDPWTVLDPLLTLMPESAAKLAPLCVPLGLDKSDFNFRKVVALYTRMTTSAAGGVAVEADASQTRSASHIEGKRAAMDAAVEAVEASLLSPLQQMELWHWIYQRESREGDDANALAALEAALAVARANPTLLLSHSRIAIESGGSAEESLLGHFSTELRTLRCRCTLRRFASSLPDSPGICDQLLSLVSNPAQVVRFMFEAVCAVAWDLHMQGASAVGTPVTVYRIAQEPLSNGVLEFVLKAAGAVDEIARHCALDVPPHGAASASNGDSPSGAQNTSLEQLRHTMIARLLSDVDGQTTADREGSGAASGAGTLSGPAKGLHGLGNDSPFTPTEAERRRREDLYLSMSIAALVVTCSSAVQRASYFAQLDLVLRNKGTRQRRLTSRSRFRAAQALQYLTSAAPTSTSVDRVELRLHLAYLYCLCELQEIRLSCSEESLLTAMGLKLVEHCILPVDASARGFAGADPRPLVRTWLHDEGGHTEVVELARDLLVVTGYQETGIWHHLVAHMTGRMMHRPLLESLTLIRAWPVFADLSFGMMGAELLSSLATSGVEAVERAEQVLKIASSRSAEMEWLHVTLADPKNTGAAGSKAQSESSQAAAQSTGHRAVLGSKLAAAAGDWEEGAPEDLMAALRCTAALSVAVLHGLSSRVRARCDATATKLETLTARAVEVGAMHLADSPAHQQRAGKRSVLLGVLAALQDCVRTLLVPAVFCGARQPDAAVVKKLTPVVAADGASFAVPSIVAANFGSAVTSTLVQGYLGQVGSMNDTRLGALLKHCAAHSDGGLLRAALKALHSRLSSAEDVAAVKSAVAALPAETRRLLQGQISKLGREAMANFAALLAN